MRNLLAISVILSLLLVTGCTRTEYVYITKTKIVELDENLFKPCTKPTKVSEDLPELAAKEKVSEDRLLSAYGKSKAGEIKCYKTVQNLEATYNRAKAKLEKESEPK